MNAQRSPAELRAMFGANLRQLIRRFPSVSDVSRQLEINRTQFNRYLSGESFPRPDILARICSFFDVDARILLEPVNELSPAGAGLTGPLLADFFGQSATVVPEGALPTGFYLFSRRSFIDPDQFVMSVVRIWRPTEGECIVRGFEAREAVRRQGLAPTTDLREFRGQCLSVEGGIAMLIGRRRALTGTFNFITRVPSFQNNFWVGFVSRTIGETRDSDRSTRMVYEYLGKSVRQVLPIARRSGYVTNENLPPFHMHLLQPDVPLR